MRLFLGLPLASEVTEQLASLSMRWRTNADGLRWSAQESWHITLQFLGSAEQEQYDCIVARLHELRSPAVPVALDGVGFFDRVGIFFAGVTLTAELLALQQRITATTRTCGYIPETRPYHPHITLARTKGKLGAKALQELKGKLHRPPVFAGFVAHEFLLYESVLTPKGSLYEVKERFPLEPV
jgi:RNA 2',3'-cyclic 3'-phosphodiesterase